MVYPTGRALTDVDKRRILDRFYDAWIRLPEQRMGQLLLNAGGAGNVFYKEDEDLIDLVEQFVDRCNPEDPG